MAQWWSIALPRRGSRVRIPSRALTRDLVNRNLFFISVLLFPEKKIGILIKIYRKYIKYVVKYIQTYIRRIKPMALVTTTEMFKKAYEGGYAIGAFNVNNMEIVQAITEAAGELNSPIILQCQQVQENMRTTHTL